jgi:two-component system, NarL family, response regulator DesR
VILAIKGFTVTNVKERPKEARKTIRVVLERDQTMVLGALAALLEIEGDISVVAQARNGREALEAVLANMPEVFITDIEMPHMSGLDVAAELKRRRTGTRVIIVTSFARTGYLRRALEAGASGYLLKDMRAEELADAVRRVHQGLRVIHPELATEAWGEMDPLTDRERQVLRLAGEGMASGDIAVELGLSDGTVRNYLSEAISKLGASNRVEAARIARTKGWL